MSASHVSVKSVVSASLNSVSASLNSVESSERERGERRAVSHHTATSTEDSTSVAEDNNNEGCSANSPDRHPQTSEELHKKVQS